MTLSPRLPTRTALVATRTAVATPQPAPRARGSPPPLPTNPEGGPVRRRLFSRPGLGAYAAAPSPQLQTPRARQEQARWPPAGAGPTTALLSVSSAALVTRPHLPAQGDVTRADATAAMTKPRGPSCFGAWAGAHPAHASPRSPPWARTPGPPVPLSSRRDVCKASVARLPSPALDQRRPAPAPRAARWSAGTPHTDPSLSPRGQHGHPPCASVLPSENNNYSCSPRAE